MPLLAVPLALFAAATAGPPEIMLATATVDRRARVIVVRTVVAAPAARALARRYRTTLRYRCGQTGWRVGQRSRPGAAADTLRWRYPARLTGRRCRLVLRVLGPEGTATRVLGTRRL